MDFVITIQHAANVHFFKHAIAELEAAGHNVYVFAREKGVTGELLDAYDIDHELLCDEPSGWLELGVTQLYYEARLLRRAHAIDPDYIITSHGIAATHVATLVGAESHVYIDTETAINGGNRLTIPFTDALYTPNSFRESYGDAHVDYPGYHELAYLHPDRFEPDPDLLRRYGVDPHEQYAVLRVGAWNGNHDIGKAGISTVGRRTIIDELAAAGRVYVSDEGDGPIPSGADPLPVPPEAFHHLLAFADLVVGEVATTTLEAGLLGTPTVRISPFAGSTEMGKFRELEAYGLVRSFHTDSEREAIDELKRLVRDPHTATIWANRRAALLETKVDVTQYILSQLLEDVPEPTPTGRDPDSNLTVPNSSGPGPGSTPKPGLSLSKPTPRPNSNRNRHQNQNQNQNQNQIHTQNRNRRR
ncbi:DUF354 domain-containing protein [Natrialba asiatica]|uniref:DUF354 domain-containing protein n=1 Tax=Natrialba asiatica (strain ATCC 700177 / DSM 12278 / JCM 9576 / FERM P-10747 / NBRC 102637 / 172P1) TaxID=29540 RepID=M0AVI9_NATA1|nr:DUF354 domain-containing protein [Natrialba asiatica]ELZ02342.1 hypothetical protein C481_06716 [Natrialba asiatica DSM 12278]